MKYFHRYCGLGRYLQFCITLPSSFNALCRGYLQNNVGSQSLCRPNLNPPSTTESPIWAMGRCLLVRNLRGLKLKRWHDELQKLIQEKHIKLFWNNWSKIKRWKANITFTEAFLGMECHNQHWLQSSGREGVFMGWNNIITSSRGQRTLMKWEFLRIVMESSLLLIRPKLMPLMRW